MIPAVAGYSRPGGAPLGLRIVRAFRVKRCGFRQLQISTVNNRDVFSQEGRFVPPELEIAQITSAMVEVARLVG
jgi:hypothetical protein